MNKKLIAVAVAGVLAAPAVMADNSVTIYGVADVGLEQVEAKGASDVRDATGTVTTQGSSLDVKGRSRVTSNSSYIGFKGQEELGGSLKAIWQIEQAIDIDDGGGSKTNGFATRDSFVGLTSEMAGTVVLGRLTTPTRAVASKLDVFPGQAGIGADTAILGNTGLNANNTLIDGKSVNSGAGSLAFDTRKANAVGLVSPKIAGMTLSAAYIANEDRSANNNPWGWGAGLTGAWGPVTAMFAYEEHRGANGLNGNSTGAGAHGSLDTNYRIGAGFSQSGLTVNAIYEMLELRAGNATAMGAGVTELSRDAFWIGAKYAMGNHEVRLAYAMAMAADQTKDFANSEVKDSEGQQISVGYGYNFSKRTQVYGVYSTVENDAGAAFDFGPGKSKTGAKAGADPEGFSIGVRHLF
jgi:predicted porin